MFGTRVIFTLVSTAFAVTTAATDFSTLPVFFFHGVTGNHSNADNFVANLTADGRNVVPLSFCETTCSLEAIVLQVPKAIAQGGAVSCAVIEEMDDHKIKRYISTAGLQNGQFIGPDKVEISIKNDGPFLTKLVPETMFNYSAYGPEDYYGKMQKDYVIYTIENPDAQYTYSQFNVNRWPQFGSFSTANFFLPVYNNVNRCLPGDDQCIYDQHRRKANFLKLEEAHFFASPADERIMPWQSSIFGCYSEVDTIEEIEIKFMNLTIVNMNDTLEYTSDTFGLKTLDERSGLRWRTSRTSAGVVMTATASGSRSTTTTCTRCCTK
ncbi:unnamed protein product [Phytophthora lilii]|uniref:Unnamed protein product n=1 Tax=Phytophthora lilii TaxID=2077276 RepID=A0A9W6TD31_9STRA|nr:unnamed protein product [Phytophthora lilii]